MNNSRFLILDRSIRRLVQYKHNQNIGNFYGRHRQTRT